MALADGSLNASFADPLQTELCSKSAAQKISLGSFSVRRLNLAATEATEAMQFAALDGGASLPPAALEDLLKNVFITYYLLDYYI